MRSSMLFLLSPTSVRLGRLIQNTKSPHQEFLDPFNDRPAGTEFSVNVQTNFEESQKFTKTSRLRSYVNDVLSISCEMQEAGVVTLSARQASTHELRNSGKWFKDACAQKETQEWLEAAYNDGSSVYLIVAFRSLEDAKLARSSTSSTINGVKSEVPIHTVANGIASTTAVVNIAGPGVGGVRDVGYGQRSVFDAPGEQIVAVQYRKVRFKWLSSSKMSLEPGNRWKSYTEWRGEAQAEDMMEVKLADGSDISDDEDLDGDESDW